MSAIETPEIRWGKRDKPFHLTGEINSDTYFQHLKTKDLSYLINLLRILHYVARGVKKPLNVLAVGSSAVLTIDYRDIDLLLCLEDPKVRLEFVDKTYDQLMGNKDFVVKNQFPKGSALGFNPLYTHYKLFVCVNNFEVHSQYDLTFLGEQGGSLEDSLTFHRKNNLAFARL